MDVACSRCYSAVLGWLPIWFGEFQMWSHFDSSDCPGQPVGLRVQLENGISGFIPLRFIDHPVEETLDNISPGAILQAKVSKIDITKFSVELTLRSSDIQVCRVDFTHLMELRCCLWVIAPICSFSAMRLRSATFVTTGLQM